MGQGMSLCIVLPAPVRMRPWPFMANSAAVACGVREAQRAAAATPRKAPPMVITGITTFEVLTA